MEIACPHCQTRMRWSEEYWDKRFKCPKCKQIFIIQKPPEENVPPVSSKTKFSNSLDVEKETGKVQKDKNSKLPGFDNQGDICASCGRAIAANEAAYEVEGRLFCMACEEKPPEQTTSKSHQKAGIADEIQVKCKRCQNIYSPNLKSNITYKAWICPNCQCKNPNLKIHYRSVADLCILGFIGGILLFLFAQSMSFNISKNARPAVSVWSGLLLILFLADEALLLVTFIRIYKSRAPWMDKPVKIMIMVVFGAAAVDKIGFSLIVFPWLVSVVALLYAIVGAYFLWLWIQTMKCTA